ncbi:MAG TPA: ferredoxin [Verrucomicrobiae bacterium]|jgi:ferredoxin|nr:ferredoxin [Verrucomicrobiae bacterium]
MPNRNEKNFGNAPGPFYVDSSCTDCDMCRVIAPAIFRRNEEIGASIAFHQPVTPEEFEQAHEGKNSCPTESIGDDGQDAQ